MGRQVGSYALCLCDSSRLCGHGKGSVCSPHYTPSGLRTGKQKQICFLVAELIEGPKIHNVSADEASRLWEVNVNCHPCEVVILLASSEAK